MPEHKRSKSERRDRNYFANLAYTKSGRPRYTQDSPILLEVFSDYGESSNGELDLLLTPDWSKSPGEVADELRLRLAEPLHEEVASGDTEDDDGDWAGSRQIAHNQSVVAVKLTFEELLCNVLPLSWWWQNALVAAKDMTPVSLCADARLKQIVRDELVEGLKGTADDDAMKPESDSRRWLIQPDFIWAARLFWIVQHSNRIGLADVSEDDFDGIADYFLDEIIPRVGRRLAELSDMAREAKLALEESEASKAKSEGNAVSGEKRLASWKPPSDPWVYSVNRNRQIRGAVYHSIGTTKADAAVRTFDVRGKGLRWAIIDSGVDARHIAFRTRDDEGEPHAEPFGEDGRSNTRIKATYDFSGIRRHLSVDQRRALKGKAGRLVDWEELEEQFGDKLRIPHRPLDYQSPKSAHGTHVAGILAADWKPNLGGADPLGPPPLSTAQTRPILGLCPEIELYDLRVFDENGAGDEFAVMSALQFVRSLNQRHDVLEVHGVNLSLAMQHEVANYACGRSPVCEECTRLVGNGVVVVAAAGNEGRSIHMTTQGRREEGYRPVSIADPGNAEAVITVGSTHRKEPHTFGVSYFSSRGPTGDGRAKPDLVAPGEKIVSTVPGDRLERQDGTSQAAPHVSGAAALLMSRHTELIGEPSRIKQLLMDSATDLGRERAYQGAGLVDVMRAMQSL